MGHPMAKKGIRKRGDRIIRHHGNKANNNGSESPNANQKPKRYSVEKIDTEKEYQNS